MRLFSLFLYFLVQCFLNQGWTVNCVKVRYDWLSDNSSKYTVGVDVELSCFQFHFKVAIFCTDKQYPALSWIDRNWSFKASGLSFRQSNRIVPNRVIISQRMVSTETKGRNFLQSLQPLDRKDKSRLEKRVKCLPCHQHVFMWLSLVCMGGCCEQRTGHVVTQFLSSHLIFPTARGPRGRPIVGRCHNDQKASAGMINCSGTKHGWRCVCVCVCTVYEWMVSERESERDSTSIDCVWTHVCVWMRVHACACVLSYPIVS